MNVVLVVCGVILCAATACAMYRMAKGPSLLDRVVASDVVVGIVVAVICLDMVRRHSYENLTLLVVLALVGFLGSVTVARFANNSRAHQDSAPGQPADHDGTGQAAETGHAAGAEGADTEAVDTEGTGPSGGGAGRTTTAPQETTGGNRA